MPLLCLPVQFEDVYRQALEYLRIDKLIGAADGAVKIVDACPDFDGGWLLLSQVSQKQGNISLAVRAATQAIRRNPSNSLHYVQLGRCLLAIGKSEDALKTARKAQQVLAGTAEDLDAVAMLYMGCGDYADALPLQQRAVVCDPASPDYRMTLAVIYQTLGDLDEAAQAYRGVLGLALDHPGALAGLARLETASASENIIDALRLQLAGPDSIPLERETRLRYALAKQLEDLGQYADSYAELATASSLKRTTIDYSVGEDQQLVATLIHLLPDRPVNAPGGVDSRAPIFVVGMPRSGTTLVERIITSHPDVTAAGELHDVGLAALDITGQGSPRRYLDTKFARLIATADMSALGKRYLERTARHQQRPRFVDKLPMNALYAGFIARALPSAKIVQLQRHPLDVCLSNFKILFRTGYDYSYVLEELADFYIAYRRLMDHWKSVLGDNYIVISYESLVQNQEQESRRLITELELDWSDECLRFYDNEQAAATASSAQVRQPIYNKAVGRWRHYREELAPLIKRLRDAGIAVQ